MEFYPLSQIVYSPGNDLPDCLTAPSQAVVLTMIRL